MAAVLVGLLLVGCTLTSQDVRLAPTGDTLYLFGRSESVTRSLCSGLGGDVTGAESRSASNPGPRLQKGAVRGCYAFRHIIVCSEGDVACLSHEELHRDGWAH